MFKSIVAYLWLGVVIIICIFVVVVCIQAVIITRQKQKILLLKREKNLIVQDLRTMRLEYECKNRIFEKHHEYIEKLKEAQSLKEYITIWKELEYESLD